MRRAASLKDSNFLLILRVRLPLGLFRPHSECGLFFVKFARDLLGQRFDEGENVLRRSLAYSLAEPVAE